MKKVILSALTAGLLFASTSLIAQVTVGPKIGLNVSSMRYKAIAAGSELSSTADIKNNLGFNVGAMLNAQVNDYFSIRPELLYNQAGYKQSDVQSFVSVEQEANYSYLSIPVNFVGQYPISEDFKLQGILGFSTSFGLSGKVKNSVSGFGGLSNQTQEQTIKMKKDPGTLNDPNAYLNGLDFGLNFGIGCQYKALVFSAIYNMGLSNLEPHYSDSTLEDDRGNDAKAFNKSMSFSVAYLFGGK